MRILTLSAEFHPIIHRGLGVYVTELGRALAAAGVEVHVVTYGAPESDEEVREQAAERLWVYRAPLHGIYPPQGTMRNMHLNFGLLSTAQKLITQENLSFDLLHTHGHQAAWAAQYLAQQHQLPLVTSFYGTVRGRHPQAAGDEIIDFVSQLEAWLVTWSQKIIAVSGSVKNELEKFFPAAAGKTAVVYPGVDLERFRSSSAKEQRESQGEKFILFVAGMEEEKGPQYLLEAFERVLAAQPAAHLRMVGEGPLLPSLKEWVKKRRLEHKVDFPGCLWGEDYTREFSRAHIGVIPSLYEPISIVSLEMMAAGLPLVIFDVDGQRELIEHEVDGLKVLPKDVNALARSLLRLLENDKLAKGLGNRARIKVEKAFSWPRAAEETLKVYRSLSKIILSK